jgi:hypothetical protein
MAGPASVNAPRIKTAKGPELDKIGAYYVDGDRRA